MTDAKDSRGRQWCEAAIVVISSIGLIALLSTASVWGPTVDKLSECNVTVKKPLPRVSAL
jgi:hypothetical protein